jgi:hypothetical protein
MPATYSDDRYNRKSGLLASSLISGLMRRRQEVVNVQLVRCLLDRDVTVASQVAQQHAASIRKGCIPGVKASWVSG